MDTPLNPELNKATIAKLNADDRVDGPDIHPVCEEENLFPTQGAPVTGKERQQQAGQKRQRLYKTGDIIPLDADSATDHKDTAGGEMRPVGVNYIDQKDGKQNRTGE